MLSSVAVCDAHSIKILLLNSAAGAVVMSLKAICTVLLIPIHSTTHLAVADSLCGEGDRAAANVHCLCTQLSPPQQSTGLVQWDNRYWQRRRPHASTPETHWARFQLCNKPGTQSQYSSTSVYQFEPSRISYPPPPCTRRQGSEGCLPGTAGT